MPGPPVLAVADVEAALRWWEERLGFAVGFVHRAADPESTPTNYAVVTRDDVEVHLARGAEMRHPERVEITIIVADLSGIVDELAARDMAPRRLPNGGVAVRDLDGNRIVFRSGYLPPHGPTRPTART